MIQEPQQITIGLVLRNEAKNIGPLLESLFDQSQTQLVREIIIVDNGSEDQTLQIIEGLKGKSPWPIEIFESSVNDLGLGRAGIVSASRTPWIAFTDGDCILPPNWIESLVQQLNENQFSNRDTAAVGGPNRLPEKTLFHSALNLSLSSPLGHGHSPQAFWPQHSQSVFHLATTNILLSKEAVLRVGNFRSTQNNVGEDVDIGRRLSAYGYELRLCPSPMVLNNCAENWKEWFLRMERFGENSIRTQFQSSSSDGMAFYLGPAYVLLMFNFTFSFYSLVLALPFWLYFFGVLAESTRLNRSEPNFKKILMTAFAFFLTHSGYARGQCQEMMAKLRRVPTSVIESKKLKSPLKFLKSR